MDDQDGVGAGEGPLNDGIGPSNPERGAPSHGVTRRQFVRGAGGAAAAGLLLSATPWSVRSALARQRGPSDDGLITSRQREGIAQGVAWIARNQAPGGSWGSSNETQVADTALSLLALMAAGNVVTAGRPLEFGSAGQSSAGVIEYRGPYAKQLARGLEYLARLAWNDRGGTKPHGYIQDDKESKMHGHGFATLALAQAAGNLGGRETTEIKAYLAGDPSRDPSQLGLADEVRWALKVAIECIEGSQDRDTGGWLYEPYEQGHEGSMTVTQIAALRAARDVGMSVSDASLAKAYEYVRTSQNLVNKQKYGGFAYTKTNKGRVSYALTAAALTTLFGLGRYGGQKGDAKAIEDGLKYLDRKFLEEGLRAQQWYYYGLFYGAQALYQAQDRRLLARDWPRIRDGILDHQLADGSFGREGYDNRSIQYCTAIAVLTLQVPLETLPIFQRR